MADISMEFYEGIDRWFEWENRLRDMSGFEMPKRYKASNSKNEYNRFVGFVKEWAFERVKSAEKRLGTASIGEVGGFDFRNKNDVINNSAEEAFAMLSFKETVDQKGEQVLDKRVNTPDKFWKTAMASGGNKKTKEAMPSIKGKNDKPVYDLFMPAYRALKDRYEKRSIWEWFTNHAQYTAERDCIKALEGIMRSLTGDSLEAVTEKLKATRDRMPALDRAACVAAEEKRLNELEAAKNAEKDKTVHDKENVQAISITEINNEDMIVDVSPVAEPVEKNKEMVMKN
jgi:hypothetical protein